MTILGRKLRDLMIAPKTRGQKALRILAIVLLAVLLLTLVFRPRGRHLYLVYGVDQYGSLQESGRSDAMMLVQLDHTRGTLTMVSMARDMIVEGERGQVKLNTIIRSDQENGPERLLDAIERNFGVRPEGWFRINFSSLVSMVDALGGVTVPLTAEEVSYINRTAGHWEGYPLTEGKSRLNGAQALTYVRCRHLDNDLGRGQRQSTFAQAAASELRHLTPKKVWNLFQTMKHAWVSSLSATEQAGLVWQALWSRYARPVRLALPFEGTWRYGNSKNGTPGLLLDLEENRRLLLEALHR